MSLRPAQELVQESSKFSLRQFFESQAAQAAIRSPAQLSNEGFAALHAQADTASPLALSSPATAASPLPALFGRAPTPAPAPAPASAPLGAASLGASLPQPTDGKFNFSRLVPVTTPIQVQHQILQKHQQQALKEVADPKPIGLHSNGSGEVMRLKAQVVTLNERLAHANANLSATSESVVRGNKALTTERAQFHAKYANLAKKLETTQAALAEAEALPKEDVVKNSKLLNAKVLELQTENEKLVATRAELTAALARAEEAAASGAADPRISQTEEELAALQTKFTSLSAQHSVLLNDKLQLEKEVEAKSEMLLAAEGNVGAANERAEAWESTASDLQEQLGASQVDVAQTDALIDELDAKLAAARAEATGAPQGVEVEAPRPALPVAEIEAYLRKQAFKNSRNPYYKEPNPEFVTKDGAGVHFRGHVIPHDAWDLMEREAQAWAEAQPIPEGDMGGDDPEAMEYLRRLAANRGNYSMEDGPPVFQDSSGVYFHGRIIRNDDWDRMEREAEQWANPELGCCNPEAARCDEMERVALEALHKTNGASEHDCEQLHEEWTFLDSLARRARHALTTGEPERVMVAHVLAGPGLGNAPFDLASHIGTNPLVMGKTIDENCLHCRATHTDAAAVEAPRDTSCAEARTNAFVQAVSKDLKFSMDGSQALYASSASTGVALRV